MWRSSLKNAEGSLTFQHVIQDIKPSLFSRKNSLCIQELEIRWRKYWWREGAGYESSNDVGESLSFFYVFYDLKFLRAFKNCKYQKTYWEGEHVTQLIKGRKWIVWSFSTYVIQDTKPNNFWRKFFSRPSRTRDIDTKIYCWKGRGGKNMGQLIERCKWESRLLVCYSGHQTRLSQQILAFPPKCLDCSFLCLYRLYYKYFIFLHIS